MKVLSIWKLITAAVLLAALSGCYTPVPEYVHEETHKYRDLNLHRDEREILQEVEFVLVPDFRLFMQGNIPQQASLKAYSKTPVKLLIDKIELRNLDTGYRLEKETRQVMPVERPFFSTGYYTSRDFPLLNSNNNMNFTEAENIGVIITYAIQGEEPKTERFLIRKQYLWGLRTLPI